MALALAATPQPTNVPPRVRLDITGGGATVTVYRLDPDGRQRRVRTTDDGPAVLTGGAATLYDAEAPAGTPVTYTTDAPGGATVTVTLPADVPWLVHPGVPARSVPLALRVGSNAEEEWGIDQGMHWVLNREKPVPINGGARYAPAPSLIVETGTPDELVALRQLLADGSPLFLNVPPDADVGIDSAYISIGAVRNARQSTMGTDTARDLELPYQVVDRPTGGTRVGITWADVAAQYPTWAALAAAVDSWAELASPDPNVTDVYPSDTLYPSDDLFPGA